MCIRDRIKQWNKWAKDNGLPGIYFVGQWEGDYPYQELLDLGLDGIIPFSRAIAEQKAAGNPLIERIKKGLARRLALPTATFSYSKVMENMYFEENRKTFCFPKIIPGYDRTPRQGARAQIYTNPTPQAFQQHIHGTLNYIMEKDYEHRLIFLDSWNEWGEGNYMEPDTKWGHAYLDALRNEIVDD